MTKRIGNKRTPAMKKRAAFMMKQIFRTPKQLAKDAAEACRRRIQTFIFEDNDTSMGNNTPYQRSRKTWERYTIEQLVDSYIVSLAKGKFSLALTDPQQEPHICQCIDKRTKPVTLYMTCAHVERTLAYCSCKPLVKVLFEMQFLPSGGKSPNVAIHFAMLNYLHVAKMTKPTAIHGFTQIANIINKEDKPLQKEVLNNVYRLYESIVNRLSSSS